MALPDWLSNTALQFINSYGKQVFGPDGQPIGLPADVRQQVQPFSDYQNLALGNVYNMTPYAQQTANTAANQLNATAGGAFLDPSTNPYLQSTFNAAAQPMINAYQTAIAPGNIAAAQKAGQFGSTAMNEQGQINQYGLGRNLDELATNIYGGAYNQERQRQIQAVSMAPQTTANLYAPSNTLYGAGAQIQQQGQNVMDTDYANAVAKYEAPYNQLSGFGGAMLQAGGGGETTSHTSTKGGSLLCTALHDRGITDDLTFEACNEFGRRTKRKIFLGYQLWARPLAWAMRRSAFLTFILKPLGLAWQKEMAARITGGHGSWLGKILLGIGMPLSGALWQTRTFVRVLHFPRCPSAVVRAIVSIRVFSINRHSFWPISHISKKILELHPTLANANSTAAVILKLGVTRAKAAIAHRIPGKVGP